jgi:thiol-disulfide isomerase/thioredoxin
VNKKTTLILIAVLAVILAGGAVIYPKLAASYTPDRALKDKGSATASAANTGADGPAENTPEPTADVNTKGDSQNTDSGGASVSEPTATDFIVYLEDGSEVKLSDNFGKPMIVNFWATWCSPCKMELPHFEDKYQEFKDSINFMMVNLTDGVRDTLESVTAFITDNQYTFPVYYDTEYSAAYAYNIMSIPTTLLIDADGNIVDTLVGTLSEKDLQACIDLLLD